MRHNEPNRRLKSLILSLFAVSLLVSAGPAGALDDDMPKSMENAIEQSALSQGDKEVLAAKARQAIRSGIPAGDVEAVVTRGMERGINTTGITELLDLAVKAKNEGMPIKALMSRIEQGLAKQVPQDRIAAAVKGLAEHLAAARPIVDKLASKGVAAKNALERENTVETVARALERSLSAKALSETSGRIIEQKGTLALFDRAVGAVTGMMEFGVPAESAAGLAQQGLARGYTEKDFERMEKRVGDAMRQGKSAEEAVRPLRDELGRDRRDERRGGGREGMSERRGDMGRGGRGR